MRDIVALLDNDLMYMDHKINNACIEIQVCSKRDEGICPYCGSPSSRIHSTYERSFQDLPIQGQKVYVTIYNRKYFCDNPQCSHKTFAESFTCLKPKSKKSERLMNEIMKVSLEVSSLTASRLLRDGVVDVGKSSICNYLKKNNKNIGQGKRRENMHR